MPNYNIHKLSYKNDYNKIKGLLKKNKNLLYEKGLYEYPIHIACFIESEQLIDLFIEYDKNILKLKNIHGQTGYHILTLYPNILLKKLYNLNDFNINITDNNGYTILIYYLLKTKNVDFSFLKKLKDLGADINEPKNNSKLINILLEKCNILDELNEIFEIDMNAYDSNGLIPLHSIISSNNINCAKKILKYNIDVNNSGIDGKHNIFEHALRYGSEEIIYLLLDLPINFQYTNHYSDTYLHGIFMSKKNSYSDNIIRIILKKTDNLNIQNIDGSSIIHLLVKNGYWNKYSYILKKKKLDLSLVNKDGKSPLDYLSKKEKQKFMKEIFGSSNKIKRELSECKSKNINFLKFKKANYTLFTAYTRDAYIYSIILLKKYSNLGLPICENKKTKQIPNKSTNKINIRFWLGLKLLYENFSGLLCTEIYWHSNDLYFIQDNFFSSIGNLLYKDYIFFNVSLVNLDINHANIIIIDNNLRTIERFDPFGVMDYNDIDKLDFLLENKLNKVISKEKKIKYKYLQPKDYLRVNSFQSLSQHENIENQNTGDVSGFCLAWCFWYLENRLNNPGVKQKILVNKLEKKLINDKTKIVEYIRSYANKLNLEKVKLLKEFKILPKEYYKVFPGIKELIHLYKLIFNKIKSIKK